MKPLLLAAVLIATTAAWGRQPVETAEQLISAIASLERRAGDASRGVEDRRRWADAAIDARARLLDTPGDDPRRVSWLIDQASAVLARLGRDAADTAVLFGVPSAEQSSRVRGVAVEAGSLLARAGALAAAVTEEQTRLALREGTGDRGAALLSAVHDEQTRGALVRGRALVLLAAADAPRRGALAQEAIDALGGLSMDDAGAEAARRVNLGAALLARGAAGDAPAAAALFDWVAGPGRTGRPGAHPATVAEALLGRVHAAAGAALEAAIRDLDRTRDAPPRTVQGLADPLWRLVFADAVGRACLARWKEGGDAALLRRAFEPHEAILAGRVEIGAEWPARRAAVYARMNALVRLAGEPVPASQLPPIALLARAVALARDEGADAEAARLLGVLIDRPDAAAVRPDALWELAAIESESGGVRAACAHAIRFAREFPGDPRVPDAIEFAVYHARATLAALPEAASESDRREARAALVDVLRLASDARPGDPRTGARRLELARLLLEAGPEADRRAALEILESIDAASPEAGDAAALYEHARVSGIDEALRELRAARQRGDEAGVGRLAAIVSYEARRAAAWAGARRRPTLDRFLVDRADAAVESGVPDDAAGIYRDVLARGARVPGGEARVRVGLGRAQLLAGDAAGGFATLRDLVTRLDAAPDPRPEAYWHAWALMLETLAGRGPDRAGAARVHLRRLLTIDPDLGGEPWRTRIRAAAGLP